MSAHEFSLIRQSGSFEKHARTNAGKKLFLMLSTIQSMQNLEKYI
jgi:hypothetical protein